MKRWALRIGLAVVGVCVLAAAAVWLTLRASLPMLDGRVLTAAVSATVAIERDALGAATVTGGSRADVAYGLGYAHAQDRFFQMDLSRRLAAGELSEVFGALAIEQDRSMRRYRFREVARRVIAEATPEQRAVLTAYTHGVNEGLASLKSRPFEYWLLRVQPTAWREEDSVLVVHAMWIDLQQNSILSERRRRKLISLAPPALAAFLYPRGSPWDAPNEPTAPPPPEPRIPLQSEFDLRATLLRVRAKAQPLPAASKAGLQRDEVVGSNNWAVAGTATATGAALIANDMHLGLRVPAVWYRARLRVTAAERVATDLIGVTLPGVPALVAGSNTHIAWGFTNSYGDWSDGRELPCDSPELTTLTERIAVKGGDPVELAVRQPRDPALAHQVVTHEDGNVCHLVAWAALAPGATTFAMFDFERAQSLDEALRLAPSVGIPQQNVVMGDRSGRIAWTILGRVPRGEDADRLWGSIAWRGFDEHPRLVDPSAQRLWTANARAVDGALEAVIGADEVGTGVSYDYGARVRQIRDGLLALDTPATPADMLRIQLDDRAILLQRWRDLLLHLIDEPAIREDARRGQVRQLLAQWEPRAAAGAVGYRYVRGFNDQLTLTLWHAFLEAFQLETRRAGPPRSFESVIWLLATEQPLHFLPPEHADWRAFLLAQLDAVISDSEAACVSLDACTWGARSPVQVQHPLSQAVPVLASLLDMPTYELSGDNDMPRVQGAAFGASERFAVSPGHEAEAYLQIAGGQSGHPLSPYYRAGFNDWARGIPTPFLPGRARHKLELSNNAVR